MRVKLLVDSLAKRFASFFKVLLPPCKYSRNIRCAYNFSVREYFLFVQQSKNSIRKYTYGIHTWCERPKVSTILHWPDLQLLRISPYPKYGCTESFEENSNFLFAKISYLVWSYLLKQSRFHAFCRSHVMKVHPPCQSNVRSLYFKLLFTHAQGNENIHNQEVSRDCISAMPQTNSVQNMAILP